MKENPSLDAIFQQALEIEDPQARDAFLKEACEGDEDLHKEVRSLMAAHFAANAFMVALADPLCSQAPVEKEGDHIGRYQLIRKIGEGGFGVVYLAEQTEPVKRPVALKVVKAGMDSKEVIARFEAERQALALMDHPHIAKVHDAGTTEGGRPYFVMELVKGEPITKFCADQDLGIKERLALFTDVCSAVQHAHQKGVIHRDLKPSNILVSTHDGKPVVKVIDFGIAKAIGMELTEHTIFTQLGRMIGTPEYMSPEQAELNALDVDTRSDIYSLGVVLYEMLTGTTPLDAERLRAAAYGEMQRLIREETPVKPSTRVSTTARRVSAGRAPDHRSLKGDLDWIVMKALEKERSRRYETAKGFAADVQHFLNQEPVAAGPPGIWYQLRTFTQRHKVLVNGVAAVLVALAAGVVMGPGLGSQAQKPAKPPNRLKPAPIDPSLLEGLALRYSFDRKEDGTIRDSSGQERHAQAPVGEWSDDPETGGCYRMSKPGDQLKAGDYKGVMGAKPRTVALWFKDDRTPNGQPISLVIWGKDRMAQRFEVRIQKGPELVVAVSNGWTAARISPDLLFDRKWHHLAATLPDDGKLADVRIYIDGKPVETALRIGGERARRRLMGAPLNATPGGPVMIGSRQVNGFIDEVMIWERALDAAEIAALYKATGGQK